MYKSLLKWVNIPFIIKPFKCRNGTGGIEFDADEEALCYPVQQDTNVIDTSGAEVVSTHQLYLKGDTVIKVTDHVVFDGIEHSIKSIHSFYRNGKIDCRVVYL